MDSASYPLNVTPLSPIETTTKTSSVRANSINIVANKKGGCGKSTVSALLAQHLTGARVLDMDPGQNSLAKFRALGAEKIAVMDGERLNVSVMDNVLEWMLDEPVTFICDVGAPAFESIRQWIMRDDVVDTLASEGKRVIFHAIISGGAAFEETVLAFKAMLDTFGDRAEFVVWTNPYFGALKATNGTLFDETPFWQATENRVSGVVRLEDLDPHYAGASFSRLLVTKQTFDEAAENPEIKRAEKVRLAKIWEPLQAQIEKALAV